MSKNTGGQVYPVHERVYVGDGFHEDIYHDGITVHDYFSGKALATINCEDYKGESWADDMAMRTHIIADAMIKERDKT